MKPTDRIMKLKTMNTDTALPTHYFRLLRTGEKYPRNTRISLPLMPPPGVTTASREYWRGLRAAEMAAWKLTGGDYLLSSAARLL